MYIETDVLYLIATILCGVPYGMYCYRSGLKAGAENTIDFLEDINYIRVDEEGNVERVSDSSYKRR